MHSYFKIDSNLYKGLIILIFCCFSIACNGQSNPYIHYSVAEGLPSSEVYSVFQDKKGFIWFATDNGVVRYDGKEMDIFQTNEGLIDPVVLEFIEDSKERLWFRSLSGKLSYFSNEKIRSFPFNDSLSFLCRKSYMESLWIDSLDQIWFGESESIIKADTMGNFVAYGQPNVLNQLQLKFVEGRLLNACKGPVISKVLINNRWSKLYVTDGEANQRNLCPLYWRGKNYFSLGKSIYQIVGDSTRPVFEGKDLIISLSLDKSENLWIGYLKNTVECYSDFNKRKAFSLSVVESRSVTAVLQDRQHGYWFSTLQDGVYYIPEIDLINQNLNFDSKITDVASFNSTDILVGDDGGRVVRLNSSGEVMSEANLGKRTVLSILPTSTNLIWVATSDNTFILNQEMKIVKEIRSSFSDLSEDKDADVWGLSGLFIFKLKFSGDPSSIVTLEGKARFIHMSDKYRFLFGRIGLEVLTPTFEEVNIPEVFERIKISNITKLNDSLLLIGTLGNGFLVVNQSDWTYQEYSLREKFNATIFMLAF